MPEYVFAAEVHVLAHDRAEAEAIIRDEVGLSEDSDYVLGSRALLIVPAQPPIGELPVTKEDHETTRESAS